MAYNNISKRCPGISKVSQWQNSAQLSQLNIEFLSLRSHDAFNTTKGTSESHTLPWRSRSHSWTQKISASNATVTTVVTIGFCLCQLIKLMISQLDLLHHPSCPWRKERTIGTATQTDFFFLGVSLDQQKPENFIIFFTSMLCQGAAIDG